MSTFHLTDKIKIAFLVSYKVEDTACIWSIKAIVCDIDTSRACSISLIPTKVFEAEVQLHTS